jgi:hypothetical protein
MSAITDFDFRVLTFISNVSTLPRLLCGGPFEGLPDSFEFPGSAVAGFDFSRTVKSEDSPRPRNPSCCLIRSRSASFILAGPKFRWQ